MRALLLVALLPAVLVAQEPARPRARDLGIAPGIFRPGPLNGITDVAGVLVGQTTVQEGDSVRTGVTAILPHGGDLFRDRVPAGLHVGNGFGKMLGVTQLRVHHTQHMAGHAAQAVPTQWLAALGAGGDREHAAPARGRTRGLALLVARPARPGPGPDRRRAD